MRRIGLLYAVLLSFSSCEEVIEVDIPTSEPKLVVNGLLRVDFDEEFVGVQIKFSETSNFFNNNRPTSLDSNPIISYGQPNPDAPELIENLTFASLYEPQPGSGIYVPDPNLSTDQRIRTSSILPNTTFLLIMEHKGKRYAARTVFSPSVPIDAIEQGDETLFDEDDTEIKITFTDTPNVENFYVFDFGESEFLALDDQFIDGQEFGFSYFPEREIAPEEELTVSILGADKAFFDYMDLVIEQTEDTGGVFETPVATVRGNVFDVTGLDNVTITDNVERPNDFALGYFAVVEEYQSSLVIE